MSCLQHLKSPPNSNKKNPKVKYNLDASTLFLASLQNKLGRRYSMCGILKKHVDATILFLPSLNIDVTWVPVFYPLVSLNHIAWMPTLYFWYPYKHKLGAYIIFW